MLCSTCGESLQLSFRRCPKCGKELATNVAHRSCDADSQKSIIETYFLAGFEYETIVSFLEKFNGIHITLSTLKWRLRDCGLKGRNSADLNQNEMRKIIREELDGPSCMCGYRAMRHTLRLKYGLCIPRSKMQSLLKELDPVSTEERRKHSQKQHIIKLLLSVLCASPPPASRSMLVVAFSGHLLLSFSLPLSLADRYPVP